MMPLLPVTATSPRPATPAQGAGESSPVSFENELAVAMGAGKSAGAPVDTGSASAANPDQVTPDPKLSGDASQVKPGEEGSELLTVVAEESEDPESDSEARAGVALTAAVPALTNEVHDGQNIKPTAETTGHGAIDPGVLATAEPEGRSGAGGSASVQPLTGLTTSIGGNAETAHAVSVNDNVSSDDGRANARSESRPLKPAGSMNGTTGLSALQASTSADATASDTHPAPVHDETAPSHTAVVSGHGSERLSAHLPTGRIRPVEQTHDGSQSTYSAGGEGRKETTLDSFAAGQSGGSGPDDGFSVAIHQSAATSSAGGAETLAHAASGLVNLATDDAARPVTGSTNDAAAGKNTAARGHAYTGGALHAEGISGTGGSLSATTGLRAPNPGNVVTESVAKANAGKESMIAAVDGHAERSASRQTSAQPLSGLTDAGRAKDATVQSFETQSYAQQKPTGSPGREGLALPVNAEQQVQVHELKAGTSTANSSVAPERSGNSTATEQHPQGSSKHEGDPAQQEKLAKHDTIELRPSVQAHSADAGRTAVSDRIEIRHAGQPVRGHQLGSALRQEVATGVERITLRIAGADGETTSVRIVVRGDSVRATIVQNNQEQAGYLTSRIDDLYQALDRRGFNEPYVLVRSSSKTEHSSPSNSSSFRDEGRDAAHDRSTEDRNHRRDRDSRSRKENRS